MKKSIIFVLLVLIYFPCFSQVINNVFFPNDNQIDKQYEIDMQNWITNYEWKVVIGKYIGLWKKQMYLEMERLISVIPESEDMIRENQKKWDESLDLSYELVFDKVNLNAVGREDFIGSFSSGRITQYRERAKYYLCLFYTIKDQKSEDGCYTDTHKTELAK
ncbi:hypothetical protein HNP77_001720 [Treponema rectale]|uniref:Lysozyme inhibitor LprI N-terminal domain-containing protein n=2 Tax=Treponema rectale TaxID=744512 RepID=A0A840SIY1_9SPIR|nr:hypothetical protein [Treponema rectale]MBB5219351.1 hypothetical protein [Treponema rectale]